MTNDDRLPLVKELVPPPEPEAAFLRLASLPHCIFLDSARRDPVLGRYSFLAADPFEYIEAAGDDATPLDRLREKLAPFTAPTIPGLPPFQGGVAGLLSYDLGRTLERVPQPRRDAFGVPFLAAGLYDVVLAFDHVEHRAWIISHGWPETDPQRRRQRARQRLEELDARLAKPLAEQPRPAAGSSERIVSLADLAPAYPVGPWPELTSNFDRASYLEAVERAIEYVRAGDVFQVNIAQRLLHPATDDSVSLYLRMRQRNAATFAGYFDLGEFQIVSASPERFVRCWNGRVEARPIKGTRRRTWLPEADLFAGDDLQQSEKDRAENVMIVDLLRNDLSRVCDAESVRVTQLCRLETYEFVQHLVSAVEGQLRPGLDAIDLFKASFPGGSITGAPKPRAMEIIAEIEPDARGPYCGSLAYIGFDGAMDSSILIRTVTAGRGWWQAPVGGGIVAQSDPVREYAETWHKAEGLLRAMR